MIYEFIYLNNTHTLEFRPKVERFFLNVILTSNIGLCKNYNIIIIIASHCNIISQTSWDEICLLQLKEKIL